MPSAIRKTVVDPLSENNPITIQILGICSALAVTVKMDTAVVMSAALIAVLTGSNVVISLLRRLIPGRIRMIVEVAVISTLVILTDQILKAFLYDISRQLSVFVGLIITNCIVMGRAEAFALKNPPGLALLDGLGNGLGYSMILLLVASMREIFGSGTWLGLRVLPQGYMGNGIALLAPGAFFALGLIIWVQRMISRKFEAE